MSEMSGLRVAQWTSRNVTEAPQIELHEDSELPSVAASVSIIMPRETSQRERTSERDDDATLSLLGAVDDLVGLLGAKEAENEKGAAVSLSKTLATGCRGRRWQISESQHQICKVYGGRWTAMVDFDSVHSPSCLNPFSMLSYDLLHCPVPRHTRRPRLRMRPQEAFVSNIYSVSLLGPRPVTRRGERVGGRGQETLLSESLPRQQVVFDVGNMFVDKENVHPQSGEGLSHLHLAASPEGFADLRATAPQSERGHRRAQREFLKPIAFN